MSRLHASGNARGHALRLLLDDAEGNVILTCPVCGEFLALGDRNGRHVASAAHYPHPDASGRMICSPLTRPEWGHLTIDDGEARSPGGPLLTLVATAER
jgi:hypothetical protein